MDDAFKLFVGLYVTENIYINKIIEDGKIMLRKSTYPGRAILITSTSVNLIRQYLAENKVVNITKPYGE